MSRTILTGGLPGFRPRFAPDQSATTPMEMPDLASAVWKGDRETVVRLLAAGVSPDALPDGPNMDPWVRGSTPLYWAALKGDVETVRLLLDAGAEVNAPHSRGRDRESREPVILTAAYFNCVEVVRLLLDRGADAKGALRIAAHSDPALRVGPKPGRDHTATVELLLERTGKRYRIAFRETIRLNLAVERGDAAGARAALVGGARVNDPIWKTGPPLVTAAINGDLPMVRLLRDAGAGPEGARNFGDTALHHAAARGDVEMATMLLDAGANINARMAEDETPLRWAAQTGQVAIVRLLIDKGADVNVVGHDLDWGHPTGTALSEARRFGHEEVVRLLEAAGAQE